MLRERVGSRAKSIDAISPMIPTAGNGVIGASSEFLDGSKQARSAVRYWIEDDDRSGKATRHGPIPVRHGRHR